MKRRITLVIGLVLLLALAVIPAAAQGSIDPGAGTTYSYLTNTTGDSASVQVTFYEQDGTPIAGPSRTIPGHGSTMIDPASTALGQGFVGSAVVSSDKPLASVVQTEYEGGPSPDGFQMGLYSGVSAGSTKVCFPTLFKVNGDRESAFAVQNTSTSPVNINIAWVGRDGVAQPGTSDTIAPGAQQTYDLMTPVAGKVPNIPNGWEGSATVTVNGAGSVAGVAVVNYGSSIPARNRTATYNAADCAGLSGPTTVSVPSQYRQLVSGNWNLWSAVNVQNLDGGAADVTLTYTPRGSNTPSLVLNKNIAGNSTSGFNTRTGGDYPASDFNPLGDSFDGTVEVASNKPIVVIVITQWARNIGANQFLEAGMYAGVNKATGALKYVVPDVKKVVTSNSRSWSATIIQNLGSATADVTIMYYDSAGNNPLTFANEQIAPLSSLGLNTFTGGDKDGSAFTPLGTAFEGSVVVTSNNGQPLAVVLNGLERPVFTPIQSASGTTNGTVVP